MDASRWSRLARARMSLSLNTSSIHFVHYPTRLAVDPDLSQEIARETELQTIKVFPSITSSADPVSAIIPTSIVNSNNNAANAAASRDAVLHSLASVLHTQTMFQQSALVVSTTSPPVTFKTSTSVQSPSYTSDLKLSISTNKAAVPTELGSATCEENSVCAQETIHDEHRRGMIAGSVVSVVVVAVFIFTAVMLCRWRNRKQLGIEPSPTWKEIKRAEKVAKEAAKRETNALAQFKSSRSICSAASETKPDRKLGGPGPAVASREELLKFLNIHPDVHRYTISNTTNDTRASDPFATPIEHAQSPNLGFDNLSFRQSQIGLALTRYSTNITKPTSSIRSALALEVAAAEEQAERPTTEEREINPDLSHKRASSLSAISNVAHDIDGETIYVCNARVENLSSARRYSLTPRIINIVASTSRSEDGANCVNTTLQPPGRPVFTRARSASPAKSSARYSGSPAKLNNHFGIEMWEIGSRRTSSEAVNKGNTDDQKSKPGNIGLAQEASTYTEDSQCTVHARMSRPGYPPTSYPIKLR